MRVFFFSFVCFLGCLKEIKKFCFTIDSDVLRMDFLKNQNEHNGLKSVLFFFLSILRMETLLDVSVLG